MPPVARAIAWSWSFPPWVTALNLFAAFIYLRGWLALHHLLPARFSATRLASFLAGMATLQIALASPIDAFDPFLLADHMFQHMLLMMFVPPLLLWSNPVLPLLHGLPRAISRAVFGPILRSRPVVALARDLTNPPLALVLMSIAMIGWHLTGPYELAVRSPGWHEVEHATFLLASLIFWWPVVQPWPSLPRWNSWTLPLYLLFADFVNSAVSAFLVFSGRVYYPSYLAMPRLAGISAQNDQVAAGMIMWVIGSLAFLIPAVAITARLLSPVRPVAPQAPKTSATGRTVRPLANAFLAFAIVLPLAALLYGYLAPGKIDIDGDVLRAHQETTPFLISVFTAPDPVPAGDLDLAVLVQDGADAAAILDGDVDIEARPAAAPNTAPVFVHATRAQSQDELLSAATLELPAAGTWNILITVRRGSQRESLQCQVVTVPSSAGAAAVP